MTHTLISLAMPTGANNATGTATNTAISITGNGQTGGTGTSVSNYAINSTSTAISQITGGINATPIGATTTTPSGGPSTGAFTTLTASGALTVTNATASTTTATGAVIVTGGVGIGGAINVGAASNIAGLTVTTAFTATGLIAGGSLATAITLPAGGTAPSGFTLTDNINQSFKVSTSTLTKTSSTALAVLPGLSIALTAGATYYISGHVHGVSTTANGFQIALVASGGLTITSGSFTARAYNGATAVVGGTVTVTALGVILNLLLAYTDVWIDGAVVVNVAGTINLEGAQNTSSATSTTFLQNSTFSAVRVS